MGSLPYVRAPRRDQLGPWLGLSFARGELRIRVRCLRVRTEECKRAQSIAREWDWRMLLPLSRMSELAEALVRDATGSGRVVECSRCVDEAPQESLG